VIFKKGCDLKISGMKTVVSRVTMGWSLHPQAFLLAQALLRLSLPTNRMYIMRGPHTIQAIRPIKPGRSNMQHIGVFICSHNFDAASPSKAFRYLVDISAFSQTFHSTLGGWHPNSARALAPLVMFEMGSPSRV